MRRAAQLAVPLTVLALVGAATARAQPAKARPLDDQTLGDYLRAVTAIDAVAQLRFDGDLLFGHEVGAFTGATERRRGLFELAGEGTLFLDEVGELPLAHQAALLRVLEEKKVRRVGGSEAIPVGARLVCATHRDQQALEATGNNKIRAAALLGIPRGTLWHKMKQHGLG